MYNAQQIYEINCKLNIVKLAKSYGIRLKKKKDTEYIAKCCFHQEDTPSLVFSIKKGVDLFHCFGCGIAGTPIMFVARYENIPIQEAIEKCARMVNLSLESDLLMKLKQPNGRYQDEQPSDLQIYNYFLSIKLRNMLKKFIGTSRYEEMKKYVDSQFKEIDNFFLNPQNLTKQKVESFYYEKEKDFTERSKK